jgi:hypothetical protein
MERIKVDSLTIFGMRSAQVNHQVVIDVRPDIVVTAEEEGLVGLISEFPVDFHGKGKIAFVNAGIIALREKQ